MPGAVFLPGDRVSLHTIEAADLELLNRNVNDPRVRRPLTSASATTMPETEAFYEDVVCDDESLNLLICVEDEDGDPMGVGDVALFDVDERTRSAEIAIAIAPEHWGNGYATDASRLLVEHAFDERNLHRVQARVMATNERSRRIWERLGFEHEGRVRENQFDDGEYVDTHYFGLLADEWRARDA
jgi:ribosomal-protein-alanine N-acetyltransferase